MSSHAGRRHPGRACQSAWPVPAPNPGGVPAYKTRANLHPLPQENRASCRVCQKLLPILPRNRTPAARGSSSPVQNGDGAWEEAIETPALRGESAGLFWTSAPPERLEGLAFRRRRGQGAPRRAPLGGQQAVSMVPGPPGLSRGWRKPPRRRGEEKGAGGRGDSSRPGDDWVVMEPRARAGACAT